MPNGWYVIVKRFSSKEEKRRIVAYVLDPSDFDAELLGFENHWNVFHVMKSGLDEGIAVGLAAFLNSTVVDRHFRLFSGHTQVNATDLRNMLYPSVEELLALAAVVGEAPTQQQLDEAVANLEQGHERQGKAN
jgi:adenine-specific DNA-methyltransferase